MKEVMTKYILKFLAVLIAVGCFSIPCIADTYNPLKRITGIVDSQDFLMSESFDYDLNGNTTAIVRGGNGNDTMDAILGRFTTPDKLSEKYTQMGGSTHCANTPLRLVDNDGYDRGKNDFTFTQSQGSDAKIDS